jgi:hypothetical protein
VALAHVRGQLGPARREFTGGFVDFLLGRGPRQF